MTAATVARFKASRAHACASAFECAGIEVGDRAGYVPTGNGVPLVVCAACLDRVEASDQLEAVTVNGEPAPLAAAGEHDITLLTAEQANAHDSTDAPAHVCTCARITKRAKFTTRPDGVVIHGNCGLPAPAKYQNPTEEPPRAQPRTDPAGNVAAESAGARDAAAGDEVRPTGEPVGAPEAGARRPEGAGRGAVEGDQERDDASGARGCVGGDPAAPVAAVPVSGIRADGAAVRLQGPEAKGPGNLRPAHEPAHDVAHGSHKVVAYGDERLPARFWEKVRVDEETGCWVWTASVRRDGYGSFSHGLATVSTHRHAYISLVGPIPDDLQIDHLCRRRRCVNPAHLEPVTQQVNIARGEGVQAQHARKTHCTNGHPFNEVNTRVFTRPDGVVGRECRACHRARERGRDPRLEIVPDDTATGNDPVTEPGGLAAFFAQPADEDEPETTLAAFYAQPSDEEDEPLHVQADRAQALFEQAMQFAESQHAAAAIAYETRQTDVSPYGNVPDSDDYLGEFRVDELVAHLNTRGIGTVVATAGVVIGLVVQVEGEEDARIVWGKP